jgi:hypothetical protein
MKEFFARLNPTERRFVVGVAVVFFLVINIVWVWPHFSDWGKTSGRMDVARAQLGTFQGGTKLIPDLEKQLAKYRGQGQVVPGPDQAVNFVRLIQNLTTAVGIFPQNMTPVHLPSDTNSFFADQAENLNVDCTEKQLVDFLYSLGAGSNSLVRVKYLSAQPDPSHQRLTARLTLVASYQKKPVGATPAAGQKPAAAPQKPATTPQKPATTAAKPIGAPPPGAAPAGFVPKTNAVINRPATNRVVPGSPAPQNLTPTKK